MIGGPGDDRMHAGPAGDGDSVSFAGYGWSAVRVDLAAGTAHGQGRDRLTGFISVDGSGRADVIRGTDGNNYIESMGGRDKIYSLAGNDYIGLDVGGVVHAGPGDDAVSMGGSGDVRSGPGNDLIQIMRGRPRVDGGTDSDTFRVFGHAKPWILGGGGVDTLDLGRRLQGVVIDLVDHSSGMGVWSVDSIFGTNRSDIIRGTDADESFHGRGGHDRLFGRGGEDSLHGDGGTDRADGGAGQDRCHAEVSISC